MKMDKREKRRAADYREENEGTARYITRMSRPIYFIYIRFIAPMVRYLQGARSDLEVELSQGSFLDEGAEVTTRGQDAEEILHTIFRAEERKLQEYEITSRIQEFPGYFQGPSETKRTSFPKGWRVIVRADKADLWNSMAEVFPSWESQESYEFKMQPWHFKRLYDKITPVGKPVVVESRKEL